MDFPIQFCPSFDKASFSINLAGNLAFFGTLVSSLSAISRTAFYILGIESGRILSEIITPIGGLMLIGAGVSITLASIQKMIFGVVGALRGGC